MTGKITAAQIEEWIKKQKSSFLADYKKLVECPSVSMQPEHKKDIEECAKIAAEYLRTAGAEVTVFKTKGNPVVFGHIENKPGAPTVAIYNHLDVQPAAKGKDGWTRDPFTFVEENGRFYSRGTTDDKGPAMTALWGAKIARELKLPINIEFIWELSEEIGCLNFDEFIEQAKSGIKANSILVSDTIWLAAGKPAISQGLRGIATGVVRLKVGGKDVHSGVCGGAARNPVTELCELVANCVDARTGEIKIPGFEKTWKPPTKEEVADFVASGFSVDSFKKANQLEKLRTEDPGEVTARIWARPTFEAHSIAGGYQGDGVKTVIAPAAELKVSFRLVPGQKPKEIWDLFERHVKKLNPDCEIKAEGTMDPHLAPKELPQNEAIMKAIEFAFGTKPVFVREGGSIGAVVTMERMLKRPVLFMGLSLPEDGYHGPDESFAWGQIEGGVKAFVKYFEQLATKG